MLARGIVPTEVAEWPFPRKTAKAALQLAEQGSFVKEMNAGYAEWTTASGPTHAERVQQGELRCSCSKL